MNYIIKAALVGDYSVGKTCIVSRFAKDIFPMYDISTLGVDFDCKIIDFKENNYKIQIWDTAGQEKFQSIVKSYIRDLNVCIVVFDVNQYKTFINLKKWLEYIICIAGDDIILQIVGNKIDLGENLREVPRELIDEFCKEHNIEYKEHNIEYMECSAKDDNNIDNIFLNIIERIDNLVKEDRINLKRYGSFNEVIPQKIKYSKSNSKLNTKSNTKSNSKLNTSTCCIIA